MTCSGAIQHFNPESLPRQQLESVSGLKSTYNVVFTTLH